MQSIMKIVYVREIIYIKKKKIIKCTNKQRRKFSTQAIVHKKVDMLKLYFSLVTL